MKTEITRRCHFTPMGLLSRKKPENAGAGEDVINADPAYHRSDCKVVQPLWRAGWQFLKKANTASSRILYYHRISSWPSSCLLGMCPKGLPAGTVTSTRICVFTAVLLMVGEEGKVTHVHQQMDGQANCVSQRTEISAPRDEAPREAT